MPVYRDRCNTCGHEEEDIRSVSAPVPEHCGVPTMRVPQAAGMALITKGGNWFHQTPAAGPVFKGGGKPRPKTISRGAGLGGHRPPPSIKRMIADAGASAEVAALAKGKT